MATIERGAQTEITQPIDPCLVFVASMPGGIRSEELRDLFTLYGTVVKTRIPVHHDTGRPRNFGFVLMQDPDEARAAIEDLDGIRLHDWAKPIQL